MKKILFISSALLYLTIARGQKTFQKTYGGFASEVARSACQTSDGGFALCGGSYSFVTGDADVYLIRTDANGDTLWTRNYGLDGSDFGYCIRQTNDKGFIIAGSEGYGGFNAYLLKVDSIGNISWSSTAYSMNTFYSVEQTSDSGYIATGYGGGTNSDIILVKISASGTLIWSKSYGSNIYEDIGYSVKQTKDGGYIVAGSTFGFGAGKLDAYLLKTDTIGNIVWTKTYGKNYDDVFYSVQQTADGGFIACGRGVNSPSSTRSSNAFLVKTDGNGDTLWTKYYTPLDQFYIFDIVQTKDLGYALIRSNYDFINSWDINLVKVDSLGNVDWSKGFGGNADDYGNSIIKTKDNGFAILGTTLSFGAGKDDYYLIKTDSTGSTGGCNEHTLSIESFNTNIVVGTGGSARPGVTLFPVLTSINNPPTIVTDTCSGSVGLVEIRKSIDSLLIYPNPFSSTTILQANNFLHNATLIVSNCFGQTVKQVRNISGKTFVISRENLSNGLYFIRLVEDNKIIATQKLSIAD